MSKAAAQACTGHAQAMIWPGVVSVAKAQRTGRSRSRHPACAAYAKAEQVPTNTEAADQTCWSAACAYATRRGKRPYLVAGALSGIEPPDPPRAQTCWSRGLHYATAWALALLNIRRLSSKSPGTPAPRRRREPRVWTRRSLSSPATEAGHASSSHVLAAPLLIRQARFASCSRAAIGSKATKSWSASLGRTADPALLQYRGRRSQRVRRRRRRCTASKAVLAPSRSPFGRLDRADRGSNARSLARIRGLL